MKLHSLTPPCLILVVLAAGVAAEEPQWAVGTAERLRQGVTEPVGNNASAPVTRSARPPVIDGRAQEWGATVPLVTFPFALRTSRAAELRFACDDSALYLIANVTDETPLVNYHTASAGPGLLEGDALRIGFDAGHPTVVTIAWSTPERKLSVLLETPGRDWQNAAALGARAASTRFAGKGYKVEAALPWALLNGKPGGKARLAWEVRWGDRTAT